ncbi:alpha-amylase [Myxococcota bacterium]|nr:alpha-amylase [Myxococcota bacterium]
MRSDEMMPCPRSTLRAPRPRAFVPGAALAALVLAACASDPTTTPDAGARDTGVVADSGVVPDSGVHPDAAVTPDSGEPPVITPNDSGWWRNAVAYEVFVRSFADSDGDGIGDLRGLTSKLDYLNDGQPGGTDLEVDALWLMPIHPSPSYHGFDVTDYRGINPDYGTMEDFETFVAAAQRRGIKVLLDFVLNHSSAEHPWFVESKDPTSPKRSWYVWADGPEPPAWRRPWDNAMVWYPYEDDFYYALFAIDIPDLNLANPDVEAEMTDTMRFWLSKGVDGFRVDAARYFIEGPDGELADRRETHDYMKRTRYTIHQEYPDALWVAEAWVTVNTLKDYYGEGNEYQLAFSFDLAAAIKQSIANGNADALLFALRAADAAYPDRGFEAPFLGNHDQERVMITFRNDLAKMRLAAAVLFALPGTPFIYYGEELAMRGGRTPREQDKRTPMRWNATPPSFGFTTSSTTWNGTVPSEDPGIDVESQLADEGSMLALFRRLIALRKTTAPLGLGTAAVAETTGGRGAVALLRTHEGARVLFVANVSADPIGSFTVTATGSPRVLYQEGLVGTPASAAGTITLEGLMPRSFAYIALD